MSETMQTNKSNNSRFPVELAKVLESREKLWNGPQKNTKLFNFQSIRNKTEWKIISLYDESVNGESRAQISLTADYKTGVP